MTDVANSIKALPISKKQKGNRATARQCAPKSIYNSFDMEVHTTGRLEGGQPAGYGWQPASSKIDEKLTNDAFPLPAQGRISSSTTSFSGLDTDIPRGSFEVPFSSQSPNGTPQKGNHTRAGSVARVQRIERIGSGNVSRSNSIQYFPAGSVKEVEHRKRDSMPSDAWISKGIRVVFPSEDAVSEPEDEGIAGDDGLLRRPNTTTTNATTQDGYLARTMKEDTRTISQGHWPGSRAIDAGTSSHDESSPAVSRPRDNTHTPTSEDKRSSRYIRSIYDAGGEQNTDSPLSRGSSLGRDAVHHSGNVSPLPMTMEAMRLGSPAPPSVASRFADSPASPRSTSTNSHRQSRDINERAGGVEDWSGVNDGEVDRFGFVMSRFNSKRSSAPVPTTLSPPSPARSGQRIVSATSSIGSRQAQLQIPRSRGSLRYSGSLSGMRNGRSTSATLRSFRSVRHQELAEAQSMLSPFQDQYEEQSAPHYDDAALRARGQLQAKREQKWRKMGALSGGAMTGAVPGKPVQIKEASYKFDVREPKLISRTWKGIPDSMRSQAWYSFLETAAAQHKSSSGKEHIDEWLIARFHELQDVDFEDDAQIDLDVPRTIGAHICFRRRYRGGQRMLFRLLHALALYFPDVGYVQGMAPIAATLLVYFEEEKAFVVAVRLWMYRGIAWLYGNGFEGLMKILEDFDNDWIQKQGGALTGIHKKLDDLGIPGMTWATKWYLTLFQYTLPYEAHLRILDVFILLGDSAGPKRKPNVDVLHSIATALLLGMREQIMAPEAQFEAVMGGLTNKVPLTGSVNGAEGGAGMDAMMHVAKLEFKARKH